MNRNPIYIAAWLLLLCFLIYLLIAVGGFTRLTDSGLSIVEWEPITGVIPPLSQTEWRAEFERYQQYPEYKYTHPDMNLAEFKRIYWVEYLHRLIGRFLAVCFFIPFIYFLIRGHLSRKLILRLSAVFLLGGFQGILGWYMVKSGLAENPAVSQYRLTAHLGLAVVLYSYLLWLALQFVEFNRVVNHYRLKLVRRYSCGCLALAGLMLVSGGFMSGTHAGYVLNTFPDMNGKWWPDMIISLSPIWRNFFENVITIQFTHRWSAVLTLIAIIGLWSFRFRLEGFHVKLVLDLLLISILLQFCLGILTLLTRVEISIALVHQSGFVLVLSLLILLLRITSPPSDRFSIIEARR